MTEQNTATAATDEGSFDLSPTSLYRLEADAVSAATLPTPMGDALAFRASSKRHPAAEGWRPLDLDRELLAGVLDLHSLGAVVMPHEWTGSAGSDLFTAANFQELLDTSPPA